MLFFPKAISSFHLINLHEHIRCDSYGSLYPRQFYHYHIMDAESIDSKNVENPSKSNDKFDDILLDSLQMETSSLCAGNYQNEPSRAC
jgi:hypothetical protein